MITSKIEDIHSTVYAGSRLFLPLANHIGVPIDKVNFLLTQIFAFVFAIFFRHVFATSKSSIVTRHLALLVPGFVLGYFAFGYQIWNLLTLGMICYILMFTCNPNIVQHVVMFVSLFYLSYLHLIRQINDYGSYIVEITVPSMIAVQKLTSLAYSIHDGNAKKAVDLSPDQERYAIRKMPSLLEFFSFIFLFPTLMSGPMFYFNDFIDFIEGKSEIEYKKTADHTKLPSTFIAVAQKLSVSILFLLLLLFVEPMFPITRLSDNSFLQQSSYLQLCWYVFISTTCARFKYYHAWKLGEAIAISAGFGLIRNEENNWNYISSVDIIGFEFATNFRACLSAWNITTQGWLRRVAYERARTYKTTATYVLSAVWHGFYPGYYITFFSGGFLTEAARIGRRKIRPHFQSNRYLIRFYDLITMLTTKAVLTYITFPFVILEFDTSYRVYSRLYFVGHIMCLLFMLFVPKLPNHKSVEKKTC